MKDNVLIEDKEKISNSFNDYFSNIGSELVNNMPPCPKDKAFSDYLKSKNSHNMFFTPISESDLITAVSSLKDNKSQEHDGIDALVVKKCINLIAFPLCHIYNASIEQGIFPNDLKIAKVIPIFKSGNMQLCSNYRPISVLSVFSKVFEKLVHKRLISFLEKNKILYQRQFGFRQGYSTFMALLEFVNNATLAFEEKKL